MGFLKGLNIHTFMDTYQEWHAFIEGFSETFCFWRARYEPSPELLEDLRAEHHYYVFGRVVGFIFLGGFITLLVKILRKR